MSETKYCCEKLAKYMELEPFNTTVRRGRHLHYFKAVDPGVPGEFVIGTGYGDEGAEFVTGEQIYYCPFCGKKIIGGKSKPRDTAIYASLGR